MANTSAIVWALSWSSFSALRLYSRSFCFSYSISLKTSLICLSCSAWSSALAASSRRAILSWYSCSMNSIFSCRTYFSRSFLDEIWFSSSRIRLLSSVSRSSSLRRSCTSASAAAESDWASWTLSSAVALASFMAFSSIFLTRSSASSLMLLTLSSYSPLAYSTCFCASALRSLMVCSHRLWMTSISSTAFLLSHLQALMVLSSFASRSLTRFSAAFALPFASAASLSAATFWVEAVRQGGGKEGSKTEK
mmetsp:Transcript_3343/g.12163  ORF Transcript_3343/g.12163 Transcript_3343/m.12163 type:complete len:250 (+) Transcript_3343:230-979(+)